MHITYRVALTAAERSYLQQVTSPGTHRARAIKRAQILLLADGRGMTDYEYTRKGVANIFVCFDRHRGWRHAKMTDTKKTADFAELMRELVDAHYPVAESPTQTIPEANLRGGCH